MNNKFFLFLLLFITTVFVSFIFLKNNVNKNKVEQGTDRESRNERKDMYPLEIEQMRKRTYPGSDITIEETLANGSNYKRYRVSYQSEGLKIYALMTVPTGPKPSAGYPVIIFNHGFIAPTQYRTTERYIAYVDGFARSGYIVFRSDYRGHDQSEGRANGAYNSPDYTVDVLNALASIKKYTNADPNHIGMWGHSMGGYITLRSMVINHDVKAGVIWAGVVASYPDLLSKWRRQTNLPSVFPSTSVRGGWRNDLVQKYGTPEENPQFWNSISANSYLKDISGPLQLHHGTADQSVPVEFSQILDTQMKTVGKYSEIYTYQGDDHNISQSFNLAMDRSIKFFDTYLKG